MELLELQAQQVAKHRGIPLKDARIYLERQAVMSQHEAENPDGCGFMYESKKLQKSEGIALSKAMERVAAENPEMYDRHVERLRANPPARTKHVRCK